MANKSDKKRRRKQQQYRVRTAREFGEVLTREATRWESEGLTANEIIEQTKATARKIGSLIADV